MTFDDFKTSANNTLWKTATDWFNASIPKPPPVVESTPTPAATLNPQPNVDTGAIIKYAAIAGAALVGIFLLTQKAGKRR